MIRSEDFDIDIGHDGQGVYVRVVHRPTGNRRTRTKVEDVGRTRDALLAELRGLVFKPEDFRIDVICGRGDGWIRVTHLPSGVSSTAENVGDSHAIVNELLDEVLDELHR